MSSEIKITDGICSSCGLASVKGRFKKDGHTIGIFNKNFPHCSHECGKEQYLSELFLQNEQYIKSEVDVVSLSLSCSPHTDLSIKKCAYCFKEDDKRFITCHDDNK